MAMLPDMLRRDRERWGMSVGEAGWRLGMKRREYVAIEVEWASAGYPSKIELDLSDAIDDEVTFTVEEFVLGCSSMIHESSSGGRTRGVESTCPGAVTCSRESASSGNLHNLPSQSTSTNTARKGTMKIAATP